VEAQEPLAYHGLVDTVSEERPSEELRRLVDEQTALRRFATLVAEGASEVELISAITSEVARLFDGDTANTMRWEGDSIRVIGDWYEEETRPGYTGRVFAFGGDTITARIVSSGSPSRIDSIDDLNTDFARARWAELGIHASIGAPIMVDGKVWGVITTSRTSPDEPFPVGAEHRLGDFAALVAQAIANAETRRQVSALLEEQAALRRVATLVAGGRPQPEVLEAVTREAGQLYEAQAVQVVKWEGVQDEVVVVACWSDGADPLVEPGSLYHPEPGSATLRVLETGLPHRTDESSPELGGRFVIAAPIIVNARLLGALTAHRPEGDPFPENSEVRLRNFSDLAAQSIANEQAHEEMRASRARIMHAADQAREKLERNLHDGAQQRLVAVSISLRLALSKLHESPGDAESLLQAAAEELTQAMEELRELARGIHPSVLTERGLAPAVQVLASRAPLPVAITTRLSERLPAPVEAAAYYVVSESLTNVAKYAEASQVQVHLACRNGTAVVEVVDDGIGGADPTRGSGLRGLADRVEALAGRLTVESPSSGGTRVWAEIPVDTF
jgi:signal transduction histidine kinase